MTYLEFRPDLIIETTNACDRVCPGCYAPNILVRPNAAMSVPNIVYLSPESLKQAWPQDELVRTACIRGGEPTLNPSIIAILQCASKRAHAVFLETNGGWISSGHPLLAVLAELDCFAKVSLDRMHGTSQDEARRQLDVLAQSRVKTAVAITESTFDQFEQTNARLLSGFQGEVFWQKKAVTKNELVRPTIGVISVTGEFKREVSNLLTLTASRAR